MMKTTLGTSAARLTRLILQEMKCGSQEAENTNKFSLSQANFRQEGSNDLASKSSNNPLLQSLTTILLINCGSFGAYFKADQMV